MNTPLLDLPLKPPKHVHLLGICGAGMAALAAGLVAQGVVVTGSDKAALPPMSDVLAQLGVTPNPGYAAEHLPQHTQWVVVGNVVSAGNAEEQAARERGIPCISMPQAIRRWLMGERDVVCVAGTHGKTTTTSLTAHLLHHAGLNPGFLAGGSAKNFSANMLLGHPNSPFVVEGDEYDSAHFDKTAKFFKYAPRWVVLTSLEFDHADIYTNLDAIRRAFTQLVCMLPQNGLLLACVDQVHVADLLEACKDYIASPVIRYGFSSQADCRITHWEDNGQASIFKTHWQGQFQLWKSPMVGQHNAQNFVAAMLMGATLGISPTVLAQGLGAFQGVQRRQDVLGKAHGSVVIDDFAHHPTAVTQTLQALKARYPNQRLWAVFEPRSFTARSMHFQHEWPLALHNADAIALATPYSSTYSASTQALDVAKVVADLQKQGRHAWTAPNTKAIAQRLVAEQRVGDVFVLMSNGAFDGLGQQLLTKLTQKQQTPP